MWLDSKAVNCPQKWGNFKATLYRYVGPNGELRQRGQKVLGNA